MAREASNLIGVGIYSVADAARLTGVSSKRIRRWLRGYRFSYGGASRSSPPVWRPQLPVLEKKLALGFLDLMEIRIVNLFLDHGVSWRVIRRASEIGSKQFDVSHPFSTKRFKTDGRMIFASVVQGGHEAGLIDIANNQYAFERVLSPNLVGMEYDKGANAIRWWPKGRRSGIVIDPQRSFGQPIVATDGVPTRILANAFAAEKSYQAVSRWYRVSVGAVRSAVEFEKQLAA